MARYYGLYQKTFGTMTTWNGVPQDRLHRFETGAAFAWWQAGRHTIHAG